MTETGGPPVSRRVYSTSPSGLVLHPMLVKLLIRESRVVGWECKVIHPDDAVNYTYAHNALSDLHVLKMSTQESTRLMLESRYARENWFISKGISILHNNCALVDPRCKKIYHINLLGKKEGRACLVLLLPSQNRIPRQYHKELQLYANEIHGVCIEQYAMCVTTVLVNIFFKEPGEGGGVGVCGICRPHFMPDATQPPGAHAPRRVSRNTRQQRPHPRPQNAAEG